MYEDELKEAPNLEGFKYCVYEELAKECDRLDIPFHLHTIRKETEFFNKYKDRAIIHRPLNVPELLKSLARYDWGLVGNIFPTPEWDVAMPNKMFEYIAACVPIVAINAPACAEVYCERGDWYKGGLPRGIG